MGACPARIMLVSSVRLCGCEAMLGEVTCNEIVLDEATNDETGKVMLDEVARGKAGDLQDLCQDRHMVKDRCIFSGDGIIQNSGIFKIIVVDWTFEIL